MKQLIRFELRKVLQNRLALISIAAVLLLSIALSLSTFLNMYTFDGSNKDGRGVFAVQIDKRIAAEYAGVLTDQTVQQMLSDFHPMNDLHGLNAKYLYQNATQSAVFARFADLNGNWNGQTVADVFGSEEIKIGYVNGWLNTSQNLAKVLLMLALVILLLVAPVFAGEYNGVDQIILTSKYGKTACATAKVIACFFAALLVTTLVLAVHLLLGVVLYGTEGLDCSILFAPVEFTEEYIPFNLTCGTVLMYQVLLAFTGAVSVTGIALLASALSKNPLIAFVTAAAIYVFPMLLPISESSVWYRLVILLPVYHAQYITLLSAAQLGNGLLYAIWAIPAAIFLGSVGAFLSRRVFARHQVS